MLYGEEGFKPSPAIQQVLDNDMGFQEISLEVLQEYAGDRIFLLTPVAEEAKQSTDKLLESAVWKSLPAVKNGFVYTQDITKTSSDATTREWLLGELPAMLGKIIPVVDRLKSSLSTPVDKLLYFIYNSIN